VRRGTRKAPNEQATSHEPLISSSQKMFLTPGSLNIEQNYRLLVQKLDCGLTKLYFFRDVIGFEGLFGLMGWFFSGCHWLGVFRCEEHLYKRLRWSVRLLVHPSIPHDARLRGKLVTSRLRFEKRKRKLITLRFLYVAIPSHLGIRRSPCFCVCYII
jgi:hypothetical protein